VVLLPPYRFCLLDDLSGSPGCGRGILFLLVFGANIWIARRARSPRLDAFIQEDLSALEVIRRRKLLNIGWLIATIFLAMMMGLIAADKWDLALRYLNRSPFGITDPIYHRDIGFYVFALPLHRFLQGWLFATLVMSAAAVLVVYAQRRSVVVLVGHLMVSSETKVHLSVLGGMAFLVISWWFGLKVFNLLYSPRGIVFGAGYTDLHARLPAYQILRWLSVACALLLFANVRRRKWRLPVTALSILVVAPVILLGIYPALVQYLVVNPNEITRESPYIVHNIHHTRAAYGLEGIKRQTMAAVSELSSQDLSDHSSTIANIALWDRRPLIQTYKQIQEMRLYYQFSHVDVDRYSIDGRLQQVMLSGRELASEKIPSKAQTWINLHLKYTHGYGLCVSPVREVTPEGLPQLIIKDIPPRSIDDLPVNRPEIYFGEETRPYIIVNTSTEEFDYPKEDGNVYTTYAGSGGVVLSTFLRRLSFALRFQDLKLMLSSYITPESRLLFRRLIYERVHTIAPFLQYDSDPYLVLANGRLFWIWDAYTITDMYPYSEPYGRGPGHTLNYIRNSVKVVIDVYHGTVNFYATDPDDPILRTYGRIFPDLFTTFDQMNQELASHIRYPRDLFKIQVILYAAYHMVDPQLFYNQEDLWNLPKEVYEASQIPLEPYYVTIRLPESDDGEFLIMIPYTPARKDNMVAWFCARCDPENYGELLVYEFPKERLIYGPMQIEARVDQDPEISRELTLWGQRGSRVLRGNLLVIPIEQSLIYVEPIYLQAVQGQLPELKRVVLAYGDAVVMEPTIDAALSRILGMPRMAKRPATVEAPIPSYSLNELIVRAREHFRRAKEALRDWNWTRSGEEMEELERILDQLVEESE
jgi:uncharacterized membrane protein (UPF0182 family)